VWEVVHKRKRVKDWVRWVAKIKFNGRQMTLGYFEDEEEAARAYDKKARELLESLLRRIFDEKGCGYHRDKRLLWISS
jgi:hypothetical protein